jgi:hypothetical protein
MLILYKSLIKTYFHVSNFLGNLLGICLIVSPHIQVTLSCYRSTCVPSWYFLNIFKKEFYRFKSILLLAISQLVSIITSSYPYLIINQEQSVKWPTFNLTYFEKWFDFLWLSNIVLVRFESKLALSSFTARINWAMNCQKNWVAFTSWYVYDIILKALNFMRHKQVLVGFDTQSTINSLAPTVCLSFKTYC